MITLLGSLLGFGTSFLPEVLGYFRANQEHKHSMQKAQLEMDLMAKRSELKLQIMDKEADIKEAEGLYEHDKIDAGGFINALRGSVRPVITYAFFALFVAIKVTALLAFMENGSELGDALTLFGMMQQLVCSLPSCRSGLATVQSVNTSKEKSNANVAMDHVVQCGVSEHDSELSSIVPGRKRTARLVT